MSAGGYVAVKSEDDDDDAVLIESTPEDLQSGLSGQSLNTVPQNAQANSDNRYMTQHAYGGDGLSRLSVPRISQMSHSVSTHSDSHGTEEVEFGFLPKRRRICMQGSRSMEVREPDYEDTGSVVYEYEQDYDCGSVVSEASYAGDEQRTLAEVLNYCQAMYDAIQKLDKKFDYLQRKVSEMLPVRMKPPPFHPRPVRLSHRSSFPMKSDKVKLQRPFHREPSMRISSAAQGRPSPAMRFRLEKKAVLLTSSTLKPVPPAPVQPEPQQTLLRQSPPLPTIVSTHSLHPPFSVANRVPGPNTQTNLGNAVPESSVIFSPVTVSTPVMSTRTSVDSIKQATTQANLSEKKTELMNYIAPSESVTISDELPSSSESANPCLEFVGDPTRNVKVLGNYLMKARQKTKPKYAARHLIRVLFPKEILLCSSIGENTRGHRALDSNKVSAVREFLADTFPNYELGEYGRDWKTCITNVNAMIRCIRCENKRGTGSSSERNDSIIEETEQSICVDSDNNEDGDVVSQTGQKATSSSDGRPPKPPMNNPAQNTLPYPSPNNVQSLEPMEFLGNPCRNVQLPFSVIYVAKGKARPELSARYLIRHLFTEDVLVKSNVYGNMERGMSPLDCNKINSLRDFLQESYPSFDLNETGYDWKACVAAINSTIRSLRHDQKKSSSGPLKKPVHAQIPCEKGTSQPQTQAGPYESDTINLMD